MKGDDDFLPHMGRMRARGSGKQARRYLSSILAAANLARGTGVKRSLSGGFDGSRMGRGASMGRVLGSRDRYAGLRRRRVIIKTRIVKLAGKGFVAAQAHLRYVERDGTTRDGSRGHLYGMEAERIDGKTFAEITKDDRHQFRMIVSPEDGAEYDDLKSLTRRLMARAEDDLGTKLDWVAVDHFNTPHPHTHIIIRGKDDRGRDLIIAREYLSNGMRERAAELVDLDLGPRSTRAIEDRLLGEIRQERLTSIDRQLLREAEREPFVSSAGKNAFDQTVRTGRLRKLERLGLARQMGATHWRLSDNLGKTLVRMGERGDIIRTMQRAFGAGTAPAAMDQSIYDPTVKGTQPLVGRILTRGLSDELNDRHYLIVEATDGRTHYVAIGRGENLEACGNGAIVRVEPVSPSVRDVDRTIARIAAANGGRYDIDAHLRHDPAASEAFAETHVRRLEAMRRLAGTVTREPDGTWIISHDHLDRAEAFERARARNMPVRVELLSASPLDQLVEAEAATWLDDELRADRPSLPRESGFGCDLQQAKERRRQWLISQGLAEESGERTLYRESLVQTLRRREILRLGARLSRELGVPFVEVENGGQISGIYRRSIDGLGGRFALIEKSRDFTLVPWRHALERQKGRAVTGTVRGGSINWTFGRGRDGPSVS